MGKTGGMAEASSPDEVKALQQLCDAVQDLKELDKSTCLRFLRARNNDKGKAEEMLRTSVEWRQANHIKEFRNWKIPQEVIDGAPYTKRAGVGHQGHPVVYIPAGAWEVRKQIEAGWKDSMVKYIYVFLEEMMHQAKVCGTDQIIVIADMAQLTYYKLAHYETIQIILHVFRTFEQNYPETLFKAVVINAPWIFPYIFNMIKPLMSSHTLGKVTIYDSNSIKWRAALLADMGSDAIPDCVC